MRLALTECAAAYMPVPMDQDGEKKEENKEENKQGEPAAACTSESEAAAPAAKKPAGEAGAIPTVAADDARPGREARLDAAENNKRVREKGKGKGTGTPTPPTPETTPPEPHQIPVGGSPTNTVIIDDAEAEAVYNKMLQEAHERKKLSLIHI